MSKSLTLHHLRPAIAKATGEPEASSIAELWEQIDSLKPQPETVPSSIEDRLDHIIALLQASPTPSPKPEAIPPVNYDGVLWNYGNRWVPAQWDSNGPIPWKGDHVQGQPDGSVKMIADANGSADFRAGSKTPKQTTGLWEADVTLPEMKAGVVVAPLWLYDGDSADEIDFEFAGRTGLQVNLHANGQQFPTRPLGDEDWSGRRAVFGIRVEDAKVTVLIDGKAIHGWNKADMPVFVSHGMQPFFEMWPVKSPSGWTDDFTGYADGEQLVMTVHGFRYTAL